CCNPERAGRPIRNLCLQGSEPECWTSAGLDSCHPDHTTLGCLGRLKSAELHAQRLPSAAQSGRQCCQILLGRVLPWVQSGRGQAVDGFNSLSNQLARPRSICTIVNVVE